MLTDQADWLLSVEKETLLLEVQDQVQMLELNQRKYLLQQFRLEEQKLKMLEMKPRSQIMSQVVEVEGGEMLHPEAGEGGSQN